MNKEEISEPQLTKDDIVTPVWPVIVMSLFIVLVFAYVKITNPTLSNDKIAINTEKIEEINVETFNAIKSDYNLLSRNNVEIAYSKDGMVESVVDEAYFQEFKVNYDDQLSDKELNEELKEVLTSYQFVDTEKSKRAGIASSYIVLAIPITGLITSAIMSKNNKAIIEDFESLSSEEENKTD